MAHVGPPPTNGADDRDDPDPHAELDTLEMQALYEGEDVRPTSRKELAGWYAYGWASEVFVVCGISSFIPITLEQLARENGVLLSDGTTPCTAKTPATHDSGSQGQCIVHFLGLDINTASFAMYAFSISVLIQALVIITMSGAADHGKFRKSLLIGFALIGAVATMLFLPVTAPVFGIAAILTIVANTCFGASNVLLNSFLPLLVRNHPEIRLHNAHALATARAEVVSPELVAADDSGDAAATLLQASEREQEELVATIAQETAADLRISAKISSTGLGIGYIAGIIVQMLAVGLVLTVKDSTFALKLCLFLIGAWWALFTLPAALWLRPRPGPPIRATALGPKDASWVSYMTHAWKSLGKTALSAGKLKDMVIFLAAWFVLSDCIATVSGTAILFAKTTLRMEAAALAMINVTVMLFGVLGAFFWGTVAQRIGLRAHQVVLLCMVIFELIPLYALLAYIPWVRDAGFLGLQQPWEVYPLAAVYGLVMGGLSSYCRSLYGELIPPGAEASFYALYAITDKGSSFFGPFVVGLITDALGEIRPAFIFLAVLVAVPIPLLAMLDIARGKQQGRALALALGQVELEGPVRVALGGAHAPTDGPG